MDRPGSYVFPLVQAAGGERADTRLLVECHKVVLKCGDADSFAQGRQRLIQKPYLALAQVLLDEGGNQIVNLGLGYAVMLEHQPNLVSSLAGVEEVDTVGYLARGDPGYRLAGGGGHPPWAFRNKVPPIKHLLATLWDVEDDERVAIPGQPGVQPRLLVEGVHRQLAVSHRILEQFRPSLKVRGRLKRSSTHTLVEGHLVVTPRLGGFELQLRLVVPVLQNINKVAVTENLHRLLGSLRQVEGIPHGVTHIGKLRIPEVNLGQVIGLHRLEDVGSHPVLRHCLEQVIVWLRHERVEDTSHAATTGSAGRTSHKLGQQGSGSPRDSPRLYRPAG